MSDISKQVIQFPNNRSAVVVSPDVNAKAADIIHALEIEQPQAVVLSIGGAGDLDNKLLPRLTQLYGRGIAKAAVDAKALVIDGGTQAGVMSLMGEAVAAHGHRTILLGVAPRTKVSYPGSELASATPLEPNHSHFVLAPGDEWGSETAVLFSLVGSLAGTDRSLENSSIAKSALSKVPAVAILAGGGEISRIEVLRVVRQNLPLIVVEGSGGLAGEIAAAYKNKGTEIEDPFMAEVISEGVLHFHSLSQSVKGIERLIIRVLGTDKVLYQAWETFAAYDFNAGRQQRRFDKLQQSLILLGVLSVAFVVIQQVFAPRDTKGNLLPSTLKDVGFWWWSLYHLLILIPIVLTILVTAANRFKQGNKWLLLRAGAESIKREIFRYRTTTSNWQNEAEERLAKAVEEITRRTMRTEVNSSALVPYDKTKGFPPYTNPSGGGDDGFSCLSPDRYVVVRLADQLRFFQRKAVKLEVQLRRLYWLTFIIGGIGTYLAAIGMQAWVALTTSMVAAFGTYLGYRQTESTLTKYNQTATDLANVKAWWEALSAEDQAAQENINSLVNHTEQVLQSELDGWVQQMQNALAGLRKEQEPPKTGTEVIAATSVTEQVTVTQTKTETATVTETTEEGEQEEAVKEMTIPIEQEPEDKKSKVTPVEKIKPIGQFE
ncbi:MAG TPA: DUF4231 domain-containing protein [Flavisolibacter sp.]|nr:DUF4231 domain-containing protein [Flavisolibacter sp.]